MNLESICRRCVDLLANGETQEAIRIAHEIIGQFPESSLGYLINGKAYLANNQLDEAISFLSKAIEIDPSSAINHASLASAYRQAGRVKDTYQEYIKALEIEPSSTSIQISTADFMFEQGLMDEAENMYSVAANHNILGRAGIVKILVYKGMHEEALELLEKHSPDEGRPVSMIHSHALLLNQKKRYEEALGMLQTVDRQTLIPSMASKHLQLIGDCHHGLQEYDAAFAEYLESNKLRNLHYEAKAHESRIGQIIKDFPNKEIFNKLPQADNKSEMPIFIVGMPRSGTSLLEQFISTHPCVFGAGELDDLIDLIERYNDGTTEALNTVADAYLSKLRALVSDEEYVTDKLPHNFLYLGVAAQLFPKSRVIYCRRNPIDTGFSCFRQHFHATHDYATDLGAIGHFQAQLIRLMDHWEKVLPLPILEVEYESVVANPQETITEVLEFCNLSWTDSIMDFYKSKRIVNTASYNQITRPLYSSSVNNAVPYMKHLTELVDALKGGFENKQP